MGEGVVRELGMDMHTLFSLKWITWITDKDLLCSTGDSAQCSVPVWMERSTGGSGHTHMYGGVPLLSTRSYHSVVNWL